MKPLLSTPWITFLGVIITIGLLVNIFLDGLIPDYEGSQGTYVLGALVGGVFGFPVVFNFFRNGEASEEEPAKPTKGKK
jgi:hypothetical protein